MWSREQGRMGNCLLTPDLDTLDFLCVGRQSESSSEEGLGTEPIIYKDL
ncbi:unnamed protein product [Gulo gulo]|uniref:Uncharacterized protein n=1 Tax=Gulo gulo TaxID=48420 RepID=A0A9X9LYV0_GULGU|nr:unnamed protein product [Gulo gulo]